MSIYYTFTGIQANLHFQRHNPENPYQHSPSIDPEVYCQYCFPPRQEGNQRFNNFWTWISAINTAHFTLHTQNIFNTLIQSDLQQEQARRNIVRLLNTITLRRPLILEEQLYLINTTKEVLIKSNNFESHPADSLTDETPNSSDFGSQTVEDPTITLEDFRNLQQQEALRNLNTTPLSNTTLESMSQRRDNDDQQSPLQPDNGIAKVLGAIGALVDALGNRNTEKIIIPIKKF